MREKDDYPLHFGGRRFTGPSKYVVTVVVLAAVALLYVLLSRWLQRAGWEEEMSTYEEEYYEGKVLE